MSREIPEPIRASVGLAATVLDDVRSLPRTLPGLPVRLVGIALQAAMKLQQQWSGLVARGDEVLTGLRGDREPGMATFDDDEQDAGGSVLVAEPIDVLRTSAFDRAPDVDTTDGAITDDEVAALPDDPAADAVVAAVEDTAAALDDTDARIGDTEVVLTEVDVMEIDIDTDAAGLVDDEVAGLPQDPAPAEVVAAIEDITDQVQGAEEVDAALGAVDTALTPEDALESALLEAEGTDTAPAAEAVPDDTPAASDPGGSPVGELAGAPDVGSDDTTLPDAADSGTADTDIGLADETTDETAAGTAAETTEGTADAGVLGEDAQPDAATDAGTEVDVLTPDGEVATVEGTVTDEGVVAPEGTEGTAGGVTEDGGAPTQGTDTGQGSDVVTDEHARVDDELGAVPDPESSGTGGAATDLAATAGPQGTTTDESSDVVTDEHARIDEELGAGPGPDEAGDTTTGDTTTSDTATSDTATSDTATSDTAVEATDEGGTPVAAATGGATDEIAGGDEPSGSEAAVTAPIEGYDSFTIAQLRGRLRGYQLATVQDLLSYEEATGNRPQFVTMLRNRLEKLEQQAVEASPLQPRGQ
ncbi:hypothetical protein [Geodermatophilus sp. URMC 63]